LGNLALISTLDLLAAFEKPYSVAQLGLTPQAQRCAGENCDAASDHRRVFDRHAIVSSEMNFSH